MNIGERLARIVAACACFRNRQLAQALADYPDWRCGECARAFTSRVAPMGRGSRRGPFFCEECCRRGDGRLP